jgi:hypothetical protein
MIRRSTWVVLILFALVLAVAIVFEQSQKGKQAEATPTAQTANLFDTAGRTITALQITDMEGNQVAMKQDDTGAWTLQQPEGMEPDTSRIESAVSQVESLQVTTQLENPPAPDIVGLDSPAYQVEVTFGDGSTQTAFIGDQTPTQNGYYARAGNGPVVIVEKFGVESIVDLVTDPPVIQTPTPTAGEGTTTPGPMGSAEPLTTPTP